MKFATSVIALALAFVALASPVERGIKPVQTAIMAISDQADALNSAIAVFKSSPSLNTVLTITSDLASLVGTVAAATDSVTSSATFTKAQSANVVSNTTALASHLDTALTSLQSQRSNFNASPLVPSIATTEGSLSQLQSAFTGLGNALSAKIAKSSTLSLDETLDSISNVVTPTLNAFA
ncbi:unnamed protein product [Peniophora sp. CBMAI 1063]|nr:unnamed protein product [Peniophora sp. CBMAI 1063]